MKRPMKALVLSNGARKEPPLDIQRGLHKRHSTKDFRYDKTSFGAPLFSGSRLATVEDQFRNKGQLEKSY
jgi:hypothetical protein